MVRTHLPTDQLTPGASDAFDHVAPPRGPLLVASDTSPVSDAAFPMAQVLSAYTGASVQVVSALRPNAMPVYAYDAVPYPIGPSPAMIDQREASVRGQMTRLVPLDTPWTVQVCTGDPVREIVQQARIRDARLIVVGRGKHHMIERVFGGETVLRLLQVGETPVLAVDPLLESLPRRVVIATDFSVFSIYAAQVTLDFIAPDAEVELVHVAPPLADVGPVLQEFARDYRAQAEQSFQSMVERLARPGLRLSTRILEGNASTRLIDHLRETGADLIASATHGYGFLRRMVLGSVTAQLVRSAPCSVLCVPGSARTHAAARAQATALHDRTLTLDLERLDAELFHFSVRNIGRGCTVEVHQRGVGAQSIGHHLPLVGVSCEAERRVVLLMFGTGAEVGEHLTHQVVGIRQVDVVVDRTERDQVLRLVHDGGETLVQLE
jgi:nucleotide-binding universal stress UspA family protein